jgi:hypothetical protein
MSQLPTRWTASEGPRHRPPWATSGHRNPNSGASSPSGRSSRSATVCVPPARGRSLMGRTDRGASIVPHDRSSNGFTPMRTGVIGSVLLKVSLIEHRRGALVHEAEFWRTLTRGREIRSVREPFQAKPCLGAWLGPGLRSPQPRFRFSPPDGSPAFPARSSHSGSCSQPALPASAPAGCGSASSAR